MARKGKTKGKVNNKPNLQQNTQQNMQQNVQQSPQNGQQSPTKKNTLTADTQNYKDTLLAYYKYNHQLPPQKDWMLYKFGLRIRDILDAKRDIKILAVGTGAGDVDIDFLDEIVKCGKERLGENGYSVLYQVVEPNAANVELFRNRVESKPEYRRVKFLWCTGTFDKFSYDFKPRENEDNKFDFVHFVRCFYHIDSVKTFDQTYNHLLAKDGIMCGIGENEDAFWPRMMHFLAERKMEHECFQCSGPVSQNYFLPGWHQLARDRDWRYESYVHGYNFDVTPIYDPENRDGNYVMDFVMHTKDSRKNLKPSIVEDFMKFLDSGKKERTVLENGVKVVKKYYPCELGAIMITKE